MLAVWLPTTDGRYSTLPAQGRRAPRKTGAYMLDPVAFRQSVARVVGTRMKDATQGPACGNNPGKPVLRSMCNGAGVGAVQGGATDFVGGEILGGEVTGGATGIPGAALGGFVGAPSEP
jgi:hypothetical protein